MDWILFFKILAAGALVFSILAFAGRLQAFTSLSRPVDRAVPKGSPRAGLVYAFTLGMAPWAKESTRLHRVAYLRGVAFHLGIFLGLGILLASPWLGRLPAAWRSLLGIGAALGAALGLAGFAARLFERNLKALSSLDDYAAVLVVSLFLACASLSLFLPAALPLFYLASSVLLVYAPFSKIRHCLYYASSRMFFGKFVGSRAILPHSQQGSR
jgi:hypothetical protein